MAGPRRMLNEKQVLDIVPVGRTTLYRMETSRIPMRAVSEATRKAMVQIARVPPVQYVALIDY